MSFNKSNGGFLKKRFLKPDQTKIDILEYLNQNSKWHSYYDLQKKLNVNYESLKLHLMFMEKLGLVELRIITSDESITGKGSYNVKINENGESFLKGLLANRN